MKKIFVILFPVFLYAFQAHAQSSFQYALFAKTHTLKAEDPKSFQKEGVTYWSVKTTLINHSRHALQYFINNNCDAAYYSVDTTALLVDFPKCDTGKVTIITLKPKEERIINLEIRANAPVSPPLSFRVVMFIFTPGNSRADLRYDELMKSHKPYILFSNPVEI